MSVADILKKISILEKRIAFKGAYEGNLEGLFSDKGTCLYFYLLGDAYLLLHTVGKGHVVGLKEDLIVEKCLSNFESGVSVAASVLEIVDPLRLLCIYSWCNALIILKNKVQKAKSIADHSFNMASMHTNVIGVESVELLQRLRDDIMLYVPKLGVDAASKSLAQSSEGGSIDKILKPKPKAKATISFASTHAEDVKAAESAGGTVPEIPLNRREIAFCARAVRRIVSLPVPVQLDVVSSASFILKALDKIFRTYVRGTALPGQLAGGNSVEFDGTTLSFRNFILRGPYISWKGFVHFLLDFAVASPPPLHTRAGKSFLAEVLNGDTSRLPGDMVEEGADAGRGGGTGGEAVVAPVSMLEATVVFVESSKSITPALVLSKFLQNYEEMAQEAEGDPWISVLSWVEHPVRADWDIKSGINFMQFVDCLGKLGMVAYKEERYAEMLPTASDKMEHFLSAHLGLTDNRKWQRKVESKLRKIKSVIKEVGSPSPTTSRKQI